LDRDISARQARRQRVNGGFNPQKISGYTAASRYLKFNFQTIKTQFCWGLILIISSRELDFKYKLEPSFEHIYQKVLARELDFEKL